MAKETSLNRKTIHRLIREMNDETENNGEKIIKIFGKGPYIFVNEIAKDIRKQYRVFGQDAIREILGGLSSSVFINNSCPTKQVIEMEEKERLF